MSFSRSHELVTGYTCLTYHHTEENVYLLMDKRLVLLTAQDVIINGVLHDICTHCDIHSANYLVWPVLL